MLRRMMFTLVLALVACAGLSRVPSETVEPTAAASPAGLPTDTASPTVTLPASPSPVPVQALPDPSTAAWTPVVGGLHQPVDLKHAGDGRLFIVEKQGVIRIVRDDILLPESFVDLRDRVGSTASEQGLLGLAFHPRFAENGRLFVDYTDGAGDTVIARYLASGLVKGIGQAIAERIVERFGEKTLEVIEKQPRRDFGPHAQAALQCHPGTRKEEK